MMLQMVVVGVVRDAVQKQTETPGRQSVVGVRAAKALAHCPASVADTAADESHPDLVRAKHRHRHCHHHRAHA